ncbi:DUF4298 domain-containing protein [Moraxella nasovis]|uniref:DUF4298 domain-containing protein n=1 Tax=Moraxella nasovis TaxID=2904121 RepID=UPI001F61F44E|nr:DUF4298 domain-containing protein [Moraxella nasovis]UNU73875.1 DUF4298 domain-containing protein [Moraxella nasovis]
MQIQNEIKKYQALYRRWLDIQSDDDKLIAVLKERAKLTQELSWFYFGDHTDKPSRWSCLYDEIEMGAQVDLKTSGEYSVMSQDTLWDMAIAERQFYEELQQLIELQLRKLNNEDESL